MKGFSSQETPSYDLAEKQSLTLDSLVVMAECNAMVAGLHFRNQAYVKGTAALVLYYHLPHLPQMFLLASAYCTYY